MLPQVAHDHERDVIVLAPFLERRRDPQQAGRKLVCRGVRQARDFDPGTTWTISNVSSSNGSATPPSLDPAVKNLLTMDQSLEDATFTLTATCTADGLTVTQSVNLGTAFP